MATHPVLPEGRAMRPLAIGYLVWHCAFALMTVALLVSVSLAYAGVFSVATVLHPTAPILGFEVPVWALLVVAWVVVLLVTCAGIGFSLGALQVCRLPEALPRTILLGRTMFVLCLVDTVLSVVQGNAPLTLASVVSACLTGSLALEVRKVEAQLVRLGEDAPATPRRSFVVDAVETIPALEHDSADAVRPFFRLLSGYATIMLAWGSLRILSGLSVLFSSRDASEGDMFVALVVAGALVIASGVYLIAVGRLGKRALCGGSSLQTFLIAGGVGLGVSVVLLGCYVVWLVQGWAPAVQDIFSAVLDVTLYAAGCFYGFRLRRELVASGRSDECGGTK